MAGIRRPFGDVLLSIAALGMLLAVLVSVDERVRDQVALRLTTHGVRTELQSAGAQMRGLAGVMYEAARDQSIEHAPMMILVVSAGALVVFMLRI